MIEADRKRRVLGWRALASDDGFYQIRLLCYVSCVLGRGRGKKGEEHGGKVSRAIGKLDTIEVSEYRSAAAAAMVTRMSGTMVVIGIGSGVSFRCFSTRDLPTLTDGNALERPCF